MLETNEGHPRMKRMMGFRTVRRESSSPSPAGQAKRLGPCGWSELDPPGRVRHDPRVKGRPYFIWDLDVSEADLRERLRASDPQIRAQWQARVMREARFADVWRYVSLEEVVRDWSWIRRHLGRSRAFWEFLLEGWRARGLLAS